MVRSMPMPYRQPAETRASSHFDCEPCHIKLKNNCIGPGFLNRIRKASEPLFGARPLLAAYECG
jgi:hypothetical protein